MTRAELIIELKEKDILLPQEILQNTTLERLAVELVAIFNSHKAQLEADSRFRANFTELVNYIYLVALSKKPQQRNKQIFNDALISFLLNSPQPV